MLSLLIIIDKLSDLSQVVDSLYENDFYFQVQRLGLHGHVSLMDFVAVHRGGKEFSELKKLHWILKRFKINQR